MRSEPRRQRQPIRVFYSPLTGKFYATRRWKETGEGGAVVTGEKRDVTQDIARAIAEFGITFTEAPK